MVTTFIAYLLLIYLFLGVERRLRQGQEAKTLQPGQHDQGSQRVLTTAFGIISVALVGAPLLNILGLARLDPEWLMGAIGLLVLITGILMRYWAAVTLGRYYTRTLRTEEQQPIIEKGPYRLIRHPGYLGIILAFFGAAIAALNGVTIVIVAVTLALAYSYRIRAEEKMLQTVIGKPYVEYMGRSWRLIPHIY